MEKIELLAPAKDKLTAMAAINYGCDAVYIGAPDFGARKKASNSLDDIKEVVDYAHKFYVKVHVTINTILDDEELEEAVKLIYELYNIGVDAIIVQDMGIFKLAIEGKLPPIELHASTQCDNRTLEKVKFFENIGVSRVILARELSLEQIKEISENTNTEIETFIHGALCVSYSGQCYMSHYIGGRSANKGECAQACRKKYSLVDEKGNVIAKDKYLLSIKDFNGSKHLKELINCGVKSFKIEGRLKDENYVKNVVAFYRTEIDKLAQKTSSGKVFLDFEPNPKKSFNRDFTDYFLEKRKDCYNFESPKSQGEFLGKISKVTKDYFEIDNQNIKINPQDGLFFGDNGCLVNSIEDGKIYPNSLDGIKKGLKVYRNLDAEFERKLENSKTKRQIGVRFEYRNCVLRVTDEDGNKLDVKIPDTASPQNFEKMEQNFITQLQKTGESDFYVQKIDVRGYIPFLSLSKINELRRIVLEKLMEIRVKNYQRKVQKPLKYAEFPIKNLDYTANIHNKQAKEFYQNCGCEVSEMSAESGAKAKELMRTKHCLKYAFDMCKSPEKLFLVDEKGEKFELVFDCKNCEMVVRPQI